MRHIALAIVLLPLAACNQGPSVSATNATAGEVAAKLQAAGGAGAMMTPGRWEGTVTIADMKMPGLPPAQQAQIASRTGKPESIVSCVTAEDLKHGGGLFSGETDDKSCKYDHFTMSGGTLDAAMACNHGGSSMAMTMKGQYTPDTMKMTVTMDGKGDGPFGTMTTTSVMDSHRVGECRGNENKSRAGRE